MSSEVLKIVDELQTLPWDTLVTFSAGYIGYFVANVGLNQRNSTVDVVFIIFIYGLVGTLFYRTPLPCLDGYSPILIAYIRTALTIVAVAVIAGLWRSIGKTFFYWIMRKFGVSYADAHETVLSRLFNYSPIKASQLTVYLKNGKILMCDDLRLFTDKPLGTFQLGINGDILMYVTDVKSSGRWKTDKEVISPWGSEITYVPASDIERISIRLM